MTKQIVFKYFYKGKEIANLEEVKKIIRHQENNTSLRVKRDEQNDVTNVFLDDSFSSNHYLSDEAAHFDFKHHRYPTYTDHCSFDNDTSFQKNNNSNYNITRYYLFPNGETVSKTQNKSGVKHNNNKPQISILFKQFPDALKAIAKASEFGHEKYKEFDEDYLNYKRVEDGIQKYADASLRHRTEIGVDEESKLPHQFHVAWNTMAELQLWIEEQNKNRK